MKTTLFPYQLGNGSGGVSTLRATAPEYQPSNNSSALVLSTGQNGETSKIFTSKLIVGLPPTAAQSQHLKELDLTKLDTSLFTAEAKITDPETGGSQIVFKLRRKLNIAQYKSLEDFWQKWSALTDVMNRDNLTSENLTALITYFAPNDVLAEQHHLLTAAMDKKTFRSFEDAYYKIDGKKIDEEIAVLKRRYVEFNAIYKKLGYSMKFSDEGVFLKVPDLRYLNARLNALYKERPHLPHVKIGYFDEEINTPQANETSDVLVSTGRDFLYNMTTNVINVIFLMLEAENRKDDSFSKGMAAYRGSITHYYTLVKRVTQKMDRLRDATYNRFGMTDQFYQMALDQKGIPQALKLAQLNLSAFLDFWLAHTCLDDLIGMTKTKMKDHLFGNIEEVRHMHYSRHFANHGEVFNPHTVSQAWESLSEFLNV